MKKISALKKRSALQGWLSILPVILVILVVRGYPMLIGLQKSFTDWNGVGQGNFIGLKNYQSILTGDVFWQLLTNNLIFLLFIPIQLFLGILVAVLIYDEIPGWRFFRVVFYIPQVISSVIIGYLFLVFFSYSGPINNILRGIGLDNLAIEWLGNGASARLVILICLVWINIGWQCMLALGGLSAIPTSVFEAAKIDGAGYWRRFFSVTVPMLGRTIEYSCIMSVIWTLTGIFPYIYSMTKGGPGYETTTVDYMIYLNSFGTSSQMGYASALSIILLIIVLVFTVVQMKASNRMNSWGE